MATETQWYSRDLLKKDAERVRTKEELAQEKTQDGKKLIETEEWKKTLAMKWIEKANLGDAGKAAVLKEIGVTEEMEAKDFIAQVALWQGENGLAKKGETLWDWVLGWRTLEAADKKITEEFDRNQNENDGEGSSDGWRLADVDADEKETLAMRAKNDEIKTQVAKLNSGESYKDDNGNEYKCTEYADGSSVVIKTSQDGKITYQDGDKYVDKKEYAKNHENTQWYKSEMQKLISQQKVDRMSLLQTPEWNNLYVDKWGTEFLREVSGKREVWNNENGWEDPKIILAQEDEKKRLDGLAVSTDPQDYYSSNWNEPNANPYELAEIAKSKIPAAINKLWITKVANDINLWRAITNERGISEVQDGSFFAFEGKWYQVVWLEKYSGPDWIFRIHLMPMNKQDPTVYSAQYLSENEGKLQRYETKDTLLAALKKPTSSLS